MVERKFDVERGRVKTVEYVDENNNSNRYNITIETELGVELTFEKVYADELKSDDKVVVYTSSNQYLCNIVAERNGAVCQYYKETYGDNRTDRIFLLVCVVAGTVLEILFMRREIYREANVGFANVLQVVWKIGLAVYCVFLLLCVLGVSGIKYLDRGAAISFFVYNISSMIYLLIVGKRQTERIKEGKER